LPLADDTGSPSSTSPLSINSATTLETVVAVKSVRRAISARLTCLWSKIVLSTSRRLWSFVFSRVAFLEGIMIIMTTSKECWGQYELIKSNELNKYKVSTFYWICQLNADR